MKKSVEIVAVVLLLTSAVQVLSEQWPPLIFAPVNISR